MALDFPTSPTNGQIYGNFIWSDAKDAWQAKPITGKVTTSPVAPTAPSNGDEWFNTNDGNLYVYYTDVDGSQWVQVKSDATLSSTLGTRVEALETTKIGLVPLVPSSVTINAGTASVNAVGEISFTGGSTVTINGIQSSNYKFYRIMLDSETVAASDIYLQYKNSGGTLATTSYTNFNISVFTNGVVGGGYAPSATKVVIGRSSGGPGTLITADISNGGTTEIKRYYSTSVDGSFFRIASGYNTTATAYTDLVISTDQNFSGGTLKVYGYN